MDLNLLVALDALLAEGSVTGAADRLGTSVPGMSRTLARLRRTTGDDILVRAGRTMVLTPRAVAMVSEVAELLYQVRSFLAPVTDLDPTRLQRTFTLRWHDAVITASATAVTARVRAQAPSVSLRFLAEPAGELNDVRDARIDLHAGSAIPQHAEIMSEPLGSDDLVVALRRDHPLVGEGLTLRRYTAAQHVSVSRRGRLHDLVDDTLAQGRLTRTVVVAAPTTAAALHLVAGSDLLAVVPSRATVGLVAALGLVTKPCPVVLPPTVLYQYWHRSNHRDPGHRWLRALVREVIGDAMKQVSSQNPDPNRPERWEPGRHR